MKEVLIFSLNCMTKLSKSSILRWNLSETQTQVEITADIRRPKVTKSWGENWLTRPSNNFNICNRWLLSLLTRHLYRTVFKEQQSRGNKNKIEFLTESQYLSTTQKQAPHRNLMTEKSNPCQNLSKTFYYLADIKTIALSSLWVFYITQS